jgi:parallel beta-helix repeat protein
MKRKALALYAVLLLIVPIMLTQPNLVLANSETFPPPSLPVIVINNDGTVEPLDVPILQVGNTYYFTGDISNYAIIIYPDNIVIDGNDFTLQGDRSVFANGIYLSNRNNVTIRNLSIKAYTNGIQMLGNVYHWNGSSWNDPKTTNYSGINIVNNSITDCATGILFAEAGNNSICGNRILNNGCGINIISSSSFNIISGNIISNNGWGLNVGDVQHNTFSFNIISENQNGTCFEYSQNNIFTGNNFTQNGFSIFFRASLVGTSNNNLFYQNNFINNSENIGESFYRNVRQTQNNFWDNGIIGNYWSDYLTKYPNASEMGNTGIGDTPYVIDATNVDNYPLMNSVVIPEVSDEDKPTTPTEEPFPTALVIAASAASIAIIGVGLLVYFRKRKR